MLKSAARRLRGWLGRRPVLTAILIVIAVWVGLGAVGAIVAGVARWCHARECRAQGNHWHQWEGCLVKADECVIGDRRIPAGAVFASGFGCYACECRRYGGPLCRSSTLCKPDPPAPCDPSSGTCIFDPGCANPRSYSVLYSFYSSRPYCGCDGLTFNAGAPTRPYRHIGACSD